MLFGTPGRSGRLGSVPYREQVGGRGVVVGGGMETMGSLLCPPCPGAPQDPAWFHVLSRQFLCLNHIVPASSNKCFITKTATLILYIASIVPHSETSLRTFIENHMGHWSL